MILMAFPHSDVSTIALFENKCREQAFTRFDRWSMRRYFANNSRSKEEGGAGRAPRSGRARVVRVYSASIHNNPGTSNSPTKD